MPDSQHPDNEEQGAESRAKRWLRAAIRIAPGAVVAGVGGALGWISNPGFGRLGGLAAVLAGVLALGRLGVHLEDHYFGYREDSNPSWTDRKRRQLNFLVALDGLLGFAMTGCGVWFICQPNNSVELFIFNVLAALFFVVTFHTLKLTDQAGLPRGHDTVGSCPAVVWLREGAATFGLGLVVYLDRVLWESEREKREQMSWLAVFIVLSLFVAGMGQLIVVGPSVARKLLAEDKKEESTPPKRPNGHRSPKKSPAPQKPGPQQPSDEADEAGTPTYEQLCGNKITPGDGAPPVEAAAIEEAWLRLGAIYAGCAGRARTIPDTSGVYYAEGHCDNRLQSVAVVSRGHRAAMLLDGPAALAAGLAAAGELRGASSRRPVAGGDFQIVQSVIGSYVAIRPPTRTQSRALKGKPQSCLDAPPDTGGYVVVPPGLAELWIQFSELGHATWPAADPSLTAPGSRAFRFHSVIDGALLAVGSCSSANRCRLQSGRRLRKSGGGVHKLSADRVEAALPQLER